MELPTIIIAALEGALNRYIALDPDGRNKLSRLQGKVIAIDIKGLAISLYVVIGSQRIHVMSQFDGETDTRLHGAPLSLLKMGLGNHSEEALFAGDVEITGDTETGQQFNQILQQLDIDWEEHLSHITGDVIAHHLGRSVRSLFNWGRQIEQSLLKDTAEYLEEEKRLVANHYEVEDFNRDVDALRNDVERVQARIIRLQEKLNHHNKTGTST